MKKVLFFPCAFKAHDHFIHLYHRANTWAESGTKLTVACLHAMQGYLLLFDIFKPKQAER